MAYAMAPTGGTGVTNYNPAYGGKPLVPAPGQSAAAAIGANNANLGQIYNLAGRTNDFNEAELLAQLEQAIPGYSSNLAQSSANTGSFLRGQLPPDVVNQMAIRAAERGVSTGSPGSPNANAAYLAAIGRSSLDLMNQGEQQFTGSIARAPKAPLFNVSQMFVTPEQQQEAAMASNIYASAPVPAAAAAERLRIAQTARGATNRPIGGLLGVNRGAGSGPVSLAAPPAPGVIGPVGALPNAISTYQPPAFNYGYNTQPEGSTYASNPAVPEGAMWNPTLGLYVDLYGQAYDEDGTPVGPAEGAQQYDPSMFADAGFDSDYLGGMESDNFEGG